MLSTFSLMSTTLNAHTTVGLFKERFSNGKTKSELKEAVESAEYFLCGSQQSPIRIEEQQIRRLFDEDPVQLRDRWLPLRQRLHNTRRQYTFSLFAQTFFAVVAWVLTIVGSYVTSLGQHSEALLLSSGTLWTWLVPLVLGWMAVGVQSREDTVRAAIQGEIKRGEYAPLKAIEATSGFLDHRIPIRDAFWMKVQGDEARQGPVYNYARILTYPKLRDRIVEEFEGKLRALHQLEKRADPGEEPGNMLEPNYPSHDSASASTQVSSDISRKTQRVKTTLVESGQTTDTVGEPYMKWGEVSLSSEWKWNFLVANSVAVFLQWGVTGSAVVISYLTEVRGLGCRSGSYLLYGIMATTAHILLLISVFLSHHVMLIYQEARHTGQDVDHDHARYTVHKWIGRLAVLTRFLGKFTAMVNSVWIILSSIFELIGFYESCWCTGTALGLKDRAWVVLFVSGDRMREEAEPSWIGGLAMSLLTIFIMYSISKGYSWGHTN